MVQEDSLGPLDQAAVLQVVGRALVDAVPAGWHRIRFEFRGTVQIDGARLESIAADGSATRHSVPKVAMREFDKLRAAMYQPDTGAWFTARYSIERTGDYTIEFDYDNEPDFTPQLTAGAYALDFQHYPRDEQHTPEWLRDRLREAQAD
ncbi:hypothetical protein OHB26_06945 [Nocardia sp. NBC_01503]|uniref:hypothetical protein n=1 Tax=Nocardia sp. NBC_01503 TaxID=2975997 RepID=UPI002E7AE2B4|nr:hypothetical protein [Nocardia sp. NBC_01503]WTL33946.1 hypothetical protein OHB26_06945 [Nocardia sp. NBC_01503]